MLHDGHPSLCDKNEVRSYALELILMDRSYDTITLLLPAIIYNIEQQAQQDTAVPPDRYIDNKSTLLTTYLTIAPLSPLPLRFTHIYFLTQTFMRRTMMIDISNNAHPRRS